eukprot:scaffold6400_cov150-Skeletonema_menzelii.AAC.2
MIFSKGSSAQRKSDIQKKTNCPLFIAIHCIALYDWLINVAHAIIPNLTSSGQLRGCSIAKQISAASQEVDEQVLKYGVIGVSGHPTLGLAMSPTRLYHR